MAYTVKQTAKFIKSFRKIPANQQRIIRKKIDVLAASPDSIKNNIKKLVGRDEYRLRIGDYRMFFTLEENILTITLLDISSRGSAYKH